MKIAINTRFLLKDKLEGIGRFTYETVRRIVLAHPEHEFYFLFDRPYDEEFIFAENVHPLVVSPPARHPFLWFWWFEIAVPRVLKKIKADVFLSPDNYISLRTQVPTILVTHDIAHYHFPDLVPFLVRKYYSYFMPKYNKKAKRIVAVSEFTKQDLVANYGILESKIDVACNGCQETFRPLSKKEKDAVKAKYTEGKNYFFYVGAVHPRKNVHVLIRAYDDFKEKTKSDVKLLIGGRFAWQTGAVTEAYNQAKNKSDIAFIGFVSETELPLLMGSCLGFVYPSLFEGFGIPVLEAMYSEVPVITSNVSSLPEVAGDAAILVNPNNLKEISEGMNTVFSSKKNRENLIEKSILQRQKFTWTRAATILWQSVEKRNK